VGATVSRVRGLRLAALSVVYSAFGCKPAPRLDEPRVSEALEEEKGEATEQLALEATESCDLARYDSAEDICDHGILPNHPFGECKRLVDGAEVHGEPFEVRPDAVAAFGGRAELFIKTYVGSGYSSNADLYLVLLLEDETRVILKHIAGWDTRLHSEPPKLQAFLATESEVSVDVREEFAESEESHPKTRHTRHACIASEAGWDCGHGCPVFKSPPPAPQCATIGRFEPTSFQEANLREYTGWWSDENALARAVDAVQELEGELPTRLDAPVSLREVVGEGGLQVWQLPGGYHVLMDHAVVILVSKVPMRFGRAEGHVLIETQPHAGLRMVRALWRGTHRISEACVEATS